MTSKIELVKLLKRYLDEHAANQNSGRCVCQLCREAREALLEMPWASRVVTK